MRGESQPTKKMHSLQKQDSSKYLTGVDVTQVASHENIDKRIANRTNREKSGISSQSKSQANNVIYKIARTAAQRSSSKNQQVVSHHGDTSSNRVDTQSSQKKSLSSYLNNNNQNSSAQQQANQVSSQKKTTAYQSVTSASANPQTANKASNAKSNGSESTTLKKVIPSHMVKPVARHASHEPQPPMGQNSMN